MIARFWWLLRRAFISTYEDGCLGIAKGAAYSALLAFVPVLTAVATLLVQAKADEVAGAILTFLFEVVPPGAEEVVRYSFTARGERPLWLLILATLLSVWAASGVMASLMEGFQAAYRLPSGRPMLKQRGVAILLVLVSAVPGLGASVLLVYGDKIQRWVFSWIGVIPQGEDLRGWVVFVGHAGRFVISMGAAALVTALLYYLGPNRRQRWRASWPGAWLAASLWLVSTTGFGWYVRNIANYNVLYGSIGAVIVMLVWMYVLSVIALLGCEYNAELERWQNIYQRRTTSQ